MDLLACSEERDMVDISGASPNVSIISRSLVSSNVAGLSTSTPTLSRQKFRGRRKVRRDRSKLYKANEKLHIKFIDVKKAKDRWNKRAKCAEKKASVHVMIPRSKAPRWQEE